MKDIFIKIIKGEIPSHKVYEDENFIGILDINPKNTGHTLIIPKVVSENIIEADSLTRANLFEVATKVSKAIKNGLEAPSIKIVANCGSEAGQEVFHTHIHLIPYYKENKDSIVNEDIAKKIRESL